MENDDFSATNSEALEYIINPSSDIILILQTMSSLLVIDSRGIRIIDEGMIANCIKNVELIVSKLNDLNTIQKWKELRFDIIMSEIKHFSDNDRLKDFARKIEIAIHTKIDELKQEEIQGLQKLNDDNFDEITHRFFYRYESLKVPRYATLSIFDSLNPIELAKTLSSLKNKNKLKFRNLLIDRYETQQSFSLSDRFGKEIPILKEIGKQLQSISKTKEDIDKWAIEELSRAFEKIVSEINSDNSSSII